MGQTLKDFKIESSKYYKFIQQKVKMVMIHKIIEHSSWTDNDQLLWLEFNKIAKIYKKINNNLTNNNNNSMGPIEFYNLLFVVEDPDPEPEYSSIFGFE